MFFIITISIMLILLSFKQKDNKVLYYFLSSVILSLMIFNFENADRGNYILMYNKAESIFSQENDEILFKLLLLSGRKLGINVHVFLGIIYAVIFILFIRFLKEWSDRPGIVLLFYLIYPFFIDMAQLRSFLATMVILNGIKYLKYFSVKNLVKFIIYVSTAGLMHSSAFFYVVLLLAYLKLKSVFKITVVSLTFLLLIRDFFYDRLTLLFPMLSKELARYRYTNISWLSIVSLVVLLGLNLLLLYFYLLYAERTDSAKAELVKLHMKINLLAMIMFPFLLNHLEFNRLFRGIIALNYTMGANVKLFNKHTGKYKLYPVLLFLMMVVMSFGFYYRFIHYNPVGDKLIYDVIFNNYLWNG